MFLRGKNHPQKGTVSVIYGHISTATSVIYSVRQDY